MNRKVESPDDLMVLGLEEGGNGRMSSLAGQFGRRREEARGLGT